VAKWQAHDPISWISFAWHHHLILIANFWCTQSIWIWGRYHPERGKELRCFRITYRQWMYSCQAGSSIGAEDERGREALLWYLQPDGASRHYSRSWLKTALAIVNERHKEGIPKICMQFILAPSREIIRSHRKRHCKTIPWEWSSLISNSVPYCPTLAKVLYHSDIIFHF
jgi:hypothetical protein